ncbi:hypothetical protein F2P81_014267 [Scophthalmus maximus]|uniref:Uncharacterized protein n=1 Tax=Scophthalmus maximus TaxID=52904 RepID=A0A6A4ST44_SCOMX|nr:hypothetical protein F2P81_014267 [Scophthalmus maximus]
MRLKRGGPNEWSYLACGEVVSDDDDDAFVFRDQDNMREMFSDPEERRQYTYKGLTSIPGISSAHSQIPAFAYCVQQHQHQQHQQQASS